MIQHLKAIHRQLYLPQAQAAPALPFTVAPINEPYLYTESAISVDRLEHPTPTVKVRVSNVGGGTLRVERMRIPRACSRWVKRTQKLTPTALKVASEPLEVELRLFPKELPKPGAVNIAELNLVSNARSKAFSKALLSVRLPKDSSAKVAVPAFINFGEITAWKVSLASSPSETVDFLLLGEFGVAQLTQLTLTQQEASETGMPAYTSVLKMPRGERHYQLKPSMPGAVMPKAKTKSAKFKRLQQTVQIANITSHPISARVQSTAEWLAAPREIQLDAYATADVPLSVNVDKLNSGRNFGELEVAGERIPVWVWYETVGETAVTLKPEKTDTPDVYDFPTKGKPLPVERVAESGISQTISKPVPKTLPIFEDQGFRFPRAEEARAGYLMGDFNGWTPRTLFLEKRDESFGITLSLPDGTYLFRAEIDGETRLEPSRLHEIVCCSQGIASCIHIARNKQQVTLRNKSKRKLKLLCRSSVEWMRIEPDTVSLPGSGRTDVTIAFSPEKLQPGLNLGWLEMENTDEPVRTLRSPILVMGMTHGAVPRLRDTELAFQSIQPGCTEGVPLLLEIFGTGELKGTIQPSTVLRFAEGDFRIQNKAVFETAHAKPLVQVLSEKPSNAYRKKCYASLVTNCYLANRRVLPFVAKYEIVHLMPEPPVLYFPEVFLFDEPQHAEITVRRNDGEFVACTAEIPKELAQHQLLTVKEKSEGCEFVLNPQVPLPAEKRRNVLRLKAQSSGITQPLSFAANIVEGIADIRIDGNRLVIANVGETALRIFSVRFENHQFYCAPHLPADTTLLAGESVTRLLKIRGQAMFFRPTVRDMLRIRLNDSRFPHGLYRKEIVADMQGRFLNFRE